MFTLQISYFLIEDRLVLNIQIQILLEEKSTLVDREFIFELVLSLLFFQENILLIVKQH